MSEKSRDPGAFDFAAGDLSADAVRRKLVQGETQAAALGAVSEALDLYSFMSALPDALVASQKREAKRLEKSSGGKHPRIEALKVSIDEAVQLRETARRGQARVDRALASVFSADDVFHGFVSGSELQVQQGYTVRLVGADGKPRDSAVTASDGYFSITLEARKKTSPVPEKNEQETALLAQMLQMLGMRGSAASAPQSARKEPNAPASELASVEILDPSGQRVQQDPIPIDLNSGTIYREYVIAGKGGEAAPKRYVGNTASRELHDTERLTSQCNFDVIRPSHKVYFGATAAAEKAGYDFCAHCFGRKDSKR